MEETVEVGRVELTEVDPNTLPSTSQVSPQHSAASYASTSQPTSTRSLPTCRSLSISQPTTRLPTER